MHRHDIVLRVAARLRVHRRTGLITLDVTSYPLTSQLSPLRWLGYPGADVQKDDAAAIRTKNLPVMGCRCVFRRGAYALPFLTPCPTLYPTQRRNV